MAESGAFTRDQLDDVVRFGLDLVSLSRAIAPDDSFELSFSSEVDDWRTIPSMVGQLVCALLGWRWEGIPEDARGLFSESSRFRADLNARYIFFASDEDGQKLVRLAGTYDATEVRRLASDYDVFGSEGDPGEARPSLRFVFLGQPRTPANEDVTTDTLFLRYCALVKDVVGREGGAAVSTLLRGLLRQLEVPSDSDSVRRRTLVLGNGLSMVMTDNALSWGDLLDKISVDAQSGRRKPWPFEEIPSPLDFEQIAAKIPNAVLRGSDPYEYLQGKVSKHLPKHPALLASSLPTKLADTSPDCIVTTNYDEVYEDAIGSALPSSLYVPSASYRSTRQRKQWEFETARFELAGEPKTIRFFHPHGTLSKKRTICLGYHQYLDLVGEISRDINLGAWRVPGTRLDMRYSRLELVMRGILRERGTWYERLFVDDVDIVGLGLSYAEYDFWWLLTKRAQLIEHPSGLSANVDDSDEGVASLMPYAPNRVFYWDVESFDTRRGLGLDRSVLGRRTLFANLDIMAPPPVWVGYDLPLAADGTTVQSSRRAAYEEGYRQILDNIATRSPSSI